MNKLFFGDNLAVLRDYVAPESVDLIYLDPPFNSNVDFNVLYETPENMRETAQRSAFEDTWRWEDDAQDTYMDLVARGGRIGPLIEGLRQSLGRSGLAAYVMMMAIRIVMLHKVLRPTGSLYLHCDPTASHYIKLLLDALFEPQNFRSEIVWRRSSSHNKLTRQYGPIHDTIFFYAKGTNATFHPGVTPHNRSYIGKAFRHEDEDGLYRQNEITGSGVRTGDSGAPWRGYDPTEKGRHWAIPKSLRHLLPADGKGMKTWEMLDALNEAGVILISPSGRPTYKQRLSRGVPYQDIWAYQPGTEGVLVGNDHCIDQDVKWLDADSERIGYPTQKPLGLLNRIINTSSNPGDVILDPFCGCGTTVESAQRLGRQWVGIDVSYYSVRLIERRMKSRFGGDYAVPIDGIPADYAGAEGLAQRDKYGFEQWVVGELGCQLWNAGKKGADGGIDGEMRFYGGPDRIGKLLVQVKGGRRSTPAQVREFRAVMDSNKADMGIFFCLGETTVEMRREAADARTFTLGSTSVPRLQLVTLDAWYSGPRPYLPTPLEFAVKGDRTTPRRKRVKPDVSQPEFRFVFERELSNLPKDQVINPMFVPEKAFANARF